MLMVLWCGLSAVGGWCAKWMFDRFMLEWNRDRDYIKAIAAEAEAVKARAWPSDKATKGDK